MNIRSIRVLVIDDSAYNRRTITNILNDINGVTVVGYAINGEDGLRKLTDLNPDLITLDLEMPRMDGFTFLRIVMHQKPTPVIVVSSRTEDENVFKALELGAVEFVGKPTARSDEQLFKIRDDLIRKVLQCAKTDMQKVLRRVPQVPAEDGIREARSSTSSEPTAPHLVLIGSSTGGPPAVQSILAAMKRSYPLMFAVSQHMPGGFTRAFAERLDKFCDLEVLEAKTGDEMRCGRVLIAPGGKNLHFRRRGQTLVAQISEPVENQRFVPSVDMMFDSAARVSPYPTLGLVLTGMGNDGAAGAIKIAGAGGRVMAESEESCVVYGMPKEAIGTGSVSRVCHLSEMAGAILDLCRVDAAVD